MSFFYVYTLQSQKDPKQHYTGYSLNLRRCLEDHNEGKNPDTKEQRPWRFRSAHAFPDKTLAQQFARYLKSDSGQDFSRRHL